LDRLVCADLTDQSQQPLTREGGTCQQFAQKADFALAGSPSSFARIFTVKGSTQMKTVTPVRKQTDNLEGQLLWEPNASVMKAGCFGAFAQAFGLEALEENSHLFVGGRLEIASTIPAKGFVIEQVSGFAKKDLRQLTSRLTHANIVVRNAPFTPVSLRKKLKLKDGSDITVFATTNAHGEHVLIRAKRIASSDPLVSDQ
ncbi:MAG: hypothetical protein Q4G38_04795, partial [Aeriscardovia aeriphila]|nr:hypothetical protein [Aeriscardovia aeriphila]